jgi:hypothetical protein
VVCLPLQLTEKVRRGPEVHLGIWRVTVELADGRMYPGVEVSWPGEIIRVPGFGRVPFTAEEIADVHDGSDFDP